MHGQRPNKQQRSRVSSREDDHPACMGEGWGTGQGSGISADRLPQTDKDEVFPEKASWLLVPCFYQFCNLIFVGLFDKSQSPRGQTLDLACSAGPAPGPMPAVWSVLICTFERGDASDIITEYSSWSRTWATWILTNMFLDWTSLEESKDVPQRHLVKAPQRHLGFI